eukprot:COSAG04_NODE_2427_length_4142_cov_2.363839_3_plen_204_part_00
MAACISVSVSASAAGACASDAACSCCLLPGLCLSQTACARSSSARLKCPHEHASSPSPAAALSAAAVDVSSRNILCAARSFRPSGRTALTPRTTHATAGYAAHDPLPRSELCPSDDIHGRHGDHAALRLMCPRVLSTAASEQTADWCGTGRRDGAERQQRRGGPEGRVHRVHAPALPTAQPIPQPRVHHRLLLAWIGVHARLL